MNFRFATHADLPELAALNHALIRDEGHRNPMTVGQLAQRMADFLANGYQAIVFEVGESTAGYALYRFDLDWVYLRQFYVRPECRRQGIGRAALQWLRTHAWTDSRRVRVEVLVGNTAGVAFWRAAGFSDYCLMLELETGG